MAVVL